MYRLFMTTALDIQNLKKTYANGHIALKGINLSVEQGDFFALLGPNGAGKSTTIGIISNLVRKSDGIVRVFGYDIDNDLEIAKSYIGIVPQEINFSQFETCIEIVMNQAGYYGLNRKLAMERAEYYLNQCQLWDRRNDRSRTLSGGLKRRLMIARAMVHEPSLLILDEPTAGVDIELRRSMWDFLTKLNEQGTTIVLTTHYLEEAERLCRNIAIIDHGEIVENTSMHELLNQLDKETYIIELEQPYTKTPVLEGFAVRQVNSHCLEVDINKQQNLNQVFHQLDKQGHIISGMRGKANRLEELFISLVDNKAS